MVVEDIVRTDQDVCNKALSCPDVCLVLAAHAVEKSTRLGRCLRRGIWGHSPGRAVIRELIRARDRIGWCPRSHVLSVDPVIGPAMR